VCSAALVCAGLDLSEVDCILICMAALRSVQDELARESGAEVGTVAASYAAMLLYIALALGGLPSRMTRSVARRVARVFVLRWAVDSCLCVCVHACEACCVASVSMLGLAMDTCVLVCACACAWILLFCTGVHAGWGHGYRCFGVCVCVYLGMLHGRLCSDGKEFIMM
jgi:hypothetical protein